MNLFIYRNVYYNYLWQFRLKLRLRYKLETFSWPKYIICAGLKIFCFPIQMYCDCVGG